MKNQQHSYIQSGALQCKEQDEGRGARTKDTCWVEEGHPPPLTAAEESQGRVLTLSQVHSCDYHLGPGAFHGESDSVFAT